MKGRPARLRLFALSLVMALSAGVNHADEVSPFDRFELFNSCEPMSVVAERLPSRAAEIGLTVESLRTAVESRLRSARLYDDDATPYLYLNVNVVGGAFSINLEYRRWVCHSVSGCGPATTWRLGVTGTHGADAGYIRSAVAECMDTFLVEYLKVNEEACSGD